MIEVVAAILIEDNGEILIAKRKAGQNLAGYWEFPGGKIEAGETPEECLFRELQEEMQVEIAVGEYFATSVHDYEGRKIKLTAYYAKIIAGDIVLIDHDEFKWINPTALKDYPLAPADEVFAEKLASIYQAK